MEADENPMEAYTKAWAVQGLELGCSRLPRELRSMEAHTMISSGGAAQGPGSWSLGLRSWPGIVCQFVFLRSRSEARVWELTCGA